MKSVLNISHLHKYDHLTYKKICEWVAKYNDDVVKFERAYGLTYLNGVVYHSHIGFEYEEDLLLFKLTFS